MSKYITLDEIGSKIDSQSAQIKQLMAEIKEMKSLMLHSKALKASQEILVSQKKENIDKPFFAVDEEMDESEKELRKKMTDEGRKMVYTVFNKFYPNVHESQRLNEILDDLFNDEVILLYLRPPHKKQKRKFAEENEINTSLFNYNCVRSIIYYLVEDSNKIFGSVVTLSAVMQGTLGANQSDVSTYNEDIRNQELVDRIKYIIGLYTY